MVIVTNQCPPLPKPPLVKLTSEQLLQVLGLNAWGMGSMFQNATSWMEEDERFIKDDSIHLFCICTMIENGMGC